jgi:hypothetical protein
MNKMTRGIFAIKNLSLNYLRSLYDTLSIFHQHLLLFFTPVFLAFVFCKKRQQAIEQFIECSFFCQVRTGTVELVGAFQ